ncbi:MAG: twin-arginine translocase TatA/TatE family subunit [Verrucomicrobiota bacterium]|nr:twin-arginine translocase TatA/TatE family subunit [Verrucomicrobiota bacterium]
MNTLASFFNLAGPDVIIIGAIIMLLFGAKRIPELARGMGQAVREFTKGKDDASNPPKPPAKV